MANITEHRNPSTGDIDRLTTEQALRVINEQDAGLADAVGREILSIAKIVDACVEKFKGGGRIVYCGAGTSGRLGILDASEIPPTFGVGDDRVVALIAGGQKAFTAAVEGAEDDEGAARRDLRSIGLSEEDALICLSASGNTPYTVSAAEYGASAGCFTAAVTCSVESRLRSVVDVAVCAAVGPEVIAGSTRLKAGTSQKMVLNMISTLVMVRSGYTTGNLMTNLKASNAKLHRRAVAILRTESGLSEGEAASLLASSGRDLRVALVSARTSADANASRAALENSDWVVAKAVSLLRSDD